MNAFSRMTHAISMHHVRTTTAHLIVHVTAATKETAEHDVTVSSASTSQETSVGGDVVQGGSITRETVVQCSLVAIINVVT